MAGGAFVSDGGGGGSYEGGVTGFVIITCIVAAMGGLLFGYDLGISGGVTSMEEFLSKFFPEVDRQMHNARRETAYCKFDNQLLQLFTSSLYLAALVSSFAASVVTRKYGRKISMFVGGLAFLIGALFNAFAVNVAMLIIGRLLLGVGVGFANQSTPVYLSEMAPAKLRGALNIGFQMAITIGILIANLINYGTSQMARNGWRVSLGLAAVPAVVMVIGSFALPDTPNSMLERGKYEQAREMLQKIRGADNVDEEFQDLCDACEAAKKVEHPWKNLFLQAKYRPALAFCSAIPFFQQFTGINVIMFYAPVLFKTLGFADDASLISAVITGVVNVVSTLVSIYAVDRYGRRILFLEGGIQMIICQIIVGSLIGAKFGTTGSGTLTPATADWVLAFICIYVAGFAWSWGPLGWLVPSEICPLEIRPAGQAVNVSVNMFFTFLIGQFFLTMLCHMKFGLFYFFGGMVLIMTIFIYFLLPETKGVPIEEMGRVWKQHPFWKRYIPDDAVTGGSEETSVKEV
ncbi:hypothetical protein F2Q70_00022065 [Brassica cretica]|uniref:Major facilitator superfamily (MFS) profile domain-containing protein n=2 Tax=Brassica cretica TaxID=69181 RepID=A0A3N6QWH3_BRACR|nr:hypothetical protein F2Q70_00022065 [Brassica cretica]KAF2558579.1 hypothetical protein F2Q68_00015866 [Brassica cretica]KAF3608279.1 hypothetical protein DY000_02048417 [Brassica cretica]